MIEVKPYTVLFEHDVGGLTEHLLPIVRAWVETGHKAIVAAPAHEMDAIHKGYNGLQSPALQFMESETANLDWGDISAMVNDQPGAPGALFRCTDSRWDIPRVTINHGLTDKNTTFPAGILGNTVGFSNVLFASGSAMFHGSWDNYVKKWPEIEHSLLRIPVGLAKTDDLFDGTYSRKEELTKMGLNPELPTVLYAPTYQKEASLETNGEAIIETLASLPVNLLVRLHHYSVDQANDLARIRGHQGKNWNERLNFIENKYPNIRHVQGNSNPYFVAADVMVGDASGASFEYLLQNKPVVFYDVPNFFKEHGTDGVGYWGRRAGVIAHDTSELCQLVRNEIDHPETHAAQRKELIDKLVYRCGGVADKAVQMLLQLIEGDLPYPTWGPRTQLWQERLLECYLSERLARCAREHRQVALYGAGMFTHRLLAFMKRQQRSLPMPNVVVILDDGDQVPSSIAGIPVEKPQENSFDAVILATDYHRNILRKRCSELFGSSLPVIDLYEAFPWHRPCVLLSKLSRNTDIPVRA